MQNQSPIPKTAFLVVKAGPWDPEQFSLVTVEVRRRSRTLVAIIRERSGSPIRFKIDGYEHAGGLLRFRINAREWSWVFKDLN